MRMIMVSEVLAPPGPEPLAASGRQVLADVLEAADFVSLRVPPLPATGHLLDAEALGTMRPDAVLSNTARGAVIDEAVLLAA